MVRTLFCLFLAWSAQAGDWTREEGIRIREGSVPFVFPLEDGSVRLYFCSGPGIRSARSTDGLNFTLEAGVRLAGSGQRGDPEFIVCDPSLVRLADGRYRLYYKGADGPGGPGQAIHRVFSAISDDGLNFQREGLRLESKDTIDAGWASVPEVVETYDGRYRMYYVTHNGPERNGIASGISDDGLSFTREPGVRMSGWVDPALFKLPNGQYWLFGLANVFPPSSSPAGIYSAHSADGLNFVADPGARVSADGPQSNIVDPTVIGIGENRYRMYYGFLGPTAVTNSAVGPDPGNAAFGVGAATSAADPFTRELAPNSLATIYGDGRLATATATASIEASGRFPLELAGTRATVNGRPAELTFVRGDQVNLVVPGDLREGPAQVVVTAGDGRITTAGATMARVAPRLFPGAVLDARTFRPGPFRLAGAPLYLALFGTGLRHARQVQVLVSGQTLEVLFAGAQPTFPGLDQVNALLPADFPFRGDLPVVLVADGRESNRVTVELE